MKYNNIIMAVNPGYLVLFFFIVLFTALEFLLVIIPAILSRSKVKRRVQQSEFDIPEYLCQPASDEYIRQIRSWYFDRNDSHWHDNNTARHAPSPVKIGDEPLNSQKLHPHDLISGTDLKNSSKTDSPQQAKYEDLDWIDEITELNPLLFSTKGSLENQENHR